MLDSYFPCPKPRIWNAACVSSGSRPEPCKICAPAAGRCWSATISIPSACAGGAAMSPTARPPCGVTRRFCPPRESAIVSLGEGWTPLIRTHRLGARIGAQSAVGQRRRPEPHRLVQSARAFLRHLHVRRTGRQEGRDPLGRKRRQRAGGLCRRGRHRIAYLHAARRPAGQLPRVQSLWRARHAGGWADQRLRQDRRRARSRAKAGSTSARSKSLTASKARRRWATKWPSRWIGNCPTPSSIPPAAAWA